MTPTCAQRICMAAAIDSTATPVTGVVLLRDAQGIVHSVVKNTQNVWCYCDIMVLKDWLEQEGKNVMPADTPITCITCLMDGHQP